MEEARIRAEEVCLSGLIACNNEPLLYFIWNFKLKQFEIQFRIVKINTINDKISFEWRVQNVPFNMRP